MLGIGYLWLLLAFVAGLWPGLSRGEWDPLGAAYAVWFLLFSMPFLLAGWYVLRVKR